MEKLQAALQKARSKRQDDASDPPAARATPKPRIKTGIKTGSAQLWNELPEITLQQNALYDHHVVTQKASKKATPFDILRTKILLQMRQHGWKRLAITSPMPRSGKTTMACNLALGLGRQDELRTMLFDLDLQAPSVGDFLGHTPKADIADMLAGRIDLADQAVRVGPNVVVSMAARRQSDATRVLLAEQTAQTFAEIEDRYAPDIMIIDTPSILVGDNTRAFLNNVDCALIVARANNTKYGHFDACEREVAQYTNVLGVVLNAFRTKDIQDYME